MFEALLVLEDAFTFLLIVLLVFLISFFDGEEHACFVQNGTADAHGSRAV